MRKWHVVLLVIAMALVDVAAASTRPRSTFMERFFAAYTTRPHVLEVRHDHSWRHRSRWAHRAVTHWAHRYQLRTRMAAQGRSTHHAKAVHRLAAVHRTDPVHRAQAIRPAEGVYSARPDSDSDVVAAVEALADPETLEPFAEPGPKTTNGCTQIIKTSYYETGRRTASGEPFRPDGLTAAHRTLPFGTRLMVTNPRTGQSVTVVINDRGPYVRGVSLDLSRGAARAIGMRGTQHVCISTFSD
jgi:rare lipoprotein A (peptidoglycan hydrolase)